MGFFQRLRRLLGLDPPSEAPPADFRQRVEGLIAEDRVKPLADLLRRHPETGKELIRAYEEELRDAGEDAREALAGRITALVGVYARVLGDSEPLSWFRARPGSPRAEAEAALTRAQQALAGGDFERAAREADAALAALDLPAPAAAEEGGELGPVPEGLLSSAHAIRGAAAANRGLFDEAAEHFERSLEHALRSDSPESRAAARLNLVDLATRRGEFAADDPSLAEALDAAAGTRFEDVAGKLLVERGVALAGRGELAGAIGLFDRVLELRPSWPFPLYQRAWVRFLQGDSGGALDDYRDVAARHPIFFTVQREIRCLEDVAAARLPIEAYRSFCVLRNRLASDAAGTGAAMENMVERHPDFAPGWLLLAEARLALGRRDAAREATREALRHDPDPDTASAALFAEWNLARAAGERDAGREAAERLASAYPGHPATEIVARLGDDPGQNRVIRWTWSLDGKLSLQELTRGDGTPPPPGSPG